MVFTIELSAQDYNMPAGGTLEIEDCAGTIYDSGGPNGDYGNSENGIIIIDPPGDDLISITIEVFNLEDSGAGCFDQLSIFDGSGTGADLFADTPAAGWCWDLTDNSGTGDLNGVTFISSGGALTLQFTSDGSVTRPGFEISYGCLNVESAPIPGIAVEPALTCDGSATFSNAGAIADIWELTYAWDFGDGNTSTDEEPNHTYADEGTYDVSLEICNQFGCTDTTFVQAVTYDSEDASCFEITMPVFDSATFSGCSATLFDSGGPDAPAVFNNDATYTITADEPNSILVLEFLLFQISTFGGDFLTIYDGPDINSPVLAFFDDGDNPPTEPVVTTGDVVTIQFQEFAFFNANYEILINCLNTEIAPEPVVGVTGPLTCSGSTAFFNAGIEAGTWDLTYNWDFGDGNTSTDEMPNHTYTNEGTYDVTLEVCNQFGCGEITDVGTITYDSQDPSCFEFIMPVNDSQIITSCNGTLFDSGGPDAPGVVQNQATTTIAPGGDNLISLEFVQLNISQFGDVLTVYDGPDVNAPIIAVFNGTNTPLVPVVSSGNSLTIEFFEGAFFQPDYEILVTCIPIVDPPTAAILTSPPFYTCNGEVTFSDVSTNAASNWNWDFGDGNTSTDENPNHVYTAQGGYDVTLIACNNLGCDTTTIAYEFLFEDDPACLGETMTMNDEDVIGECSGILYDSGGSDGNYQNNEFSTVVLGGPGAEGVTLVFTEFQVGSGFDADVVNIYDGEDSNAPLIGSFAGNILPNFGAPVEASGSFMTIELVADAFTDGAGFTAYWNVQGGTEPPEAGFVVETLNPAFGVPVQFTDITTELPTSWFWDFGDGDNDFVQNPEHIYTTPGENVVTLNASNCVGSDDAESIIVNVQGPPLLLTDPVNIDDAGFSITMEAGETFDTTFTIQNFGGGDLYYELDGFENTFAGLVQILAYDFGGNVPSNAAVIPNIEGIVFDNLSGVTFNTTNTTSVPELEELLENTNIFLVAGQSGNDLNSDIMTTFGPTLQNFVNDGGAVFFMGSQRPDMMFNTGLMEGEFELDPFSGDTLYERVDYFNPDLFHDASHPITDDVEKEFEGKSGCAGVKFTNPDITSLIVESGFDVLSYREQGEGKVLYFGFNYFFSNEPMEEILINAILWSGTQENAVQWLFADPEGGIVQPGSEFNEEITLTFNSVGAPGGTYTATLTIQSNDPGNSEIEIPVQITIIGTPAFEINTTELDFGNVVQFTTEELQATISNPGTDSLFVTNIILPSDEFSVDPAEFGLYPTLTQNITISFSPEEVQEIEDFVIIIQTNVGDFEMLIDANATGAPVAGANPTPVEITVALGESGSAELDLTNAGLGFLEYDLENPLASSNGFLLDFTTSVFTGGFFWQIINENGDIVLETMPGDYTEGLTNFTVEITTLDPCESYTLFMSGGGVDAYSVSNLLTGDLIDSGNFVPYNGLTIELGELNPNWISIAEPSGELPWPNGEETVIVEVDPSCLLGGVYESSIFLNTNDPINPVIEVPVIMTVLGPAASVNPSELEITLLSGESGELEFTLFNTGQADLDYDISLASGSVGFEFCFDLDSFPGEFFWQLLDSNGNVVQQVTNGTYPAGNTNYCEVLQGLDPAEEYTLQLSDTFGDGALDNYTITDLVSGDVVAEGTFPDGDSEVAFLGSPTQAVEITFDPATGGVDFPGDQNVTIGVDATGATAGVYETIVLVETNDSDNPVIEVVVIVNVIAFPQAVFGADNDPVVCGTEPVNFSDNSINVPTEWFWDFGDGTTSMEQNPTHQYSQSGTYDVTLIASNDVGTDTTVLEAFIIVDIECVNASIDPSSATTIEGCNGELFDSGGEDGVYALNSNGIITIAPPGAISVAVTFTEFQYEDGFDFLNIYDGPDTSSALIGQYTGTELVGQTIFSTGSSITLEEVTDPFLGIAGFAAFFACEAPTIAPEANFEFTSNSSCGGEFQFTDESLNFATSWAWDFGDGNTSDEKDPVHQYEATGLYTVTLEATNDFGTDTYTEEVDVFILVIDATVPPAGVADQAVNFSIDNFEGGWLVNWDFGDGSTPTNITNPNHTYTNIEGEADTFNVVLTVADPTIGNDCVFTVEEEIIITVDEPAPMVNLTLQVQTNLDFIEVAAEGMFVAIVFDGFTESVEMEEIDTDLYSATISVPQNSTYFYRFVNGTEEEAVPEACGAEDGNGTLARSVTVAEEPAVVVDVVCFALCQTCILDGIGSIPNAQLSIAPNPSNGLLNYNLTMEEASDLQLVITNAIGEVIYQNFLENQSVYQEKIDLTTYPNGLYWVRFTNDKQQLVEPFVLQR